MKPISISRAAALIALAALFVAPRETTAQTDEVTTYKDWSVSCFTQAETGVRSCEMSQIVFGDEARTQRTLLVAVDYNQTDSEPGMLLVLPLGISLPPGVFLQIDQGDPQQVPVERCEPGGCRIELLLPAAYLDALRAGSQATVYAHDPRRRRFAVSFSLQGFTAGLNAIAAN